ncbi:MAG TPA: sugar ABC transporter ATP-binding protein [Anaerolineaceae bacterium]|nr:sugar ABC transporter ATP-binding protein [Anaerolineaceae bacterium]
MDHQPPVLSMRKICKSFAGIQVLKEVDLDLYAGEAHCLVGENGAGKSTLIKIISGAYQPDSGSITYQGQLLKNVSPHWAREHGINTIYQEIDLIPTLSAAENISLGIEPIKKNGSIDWPALRERATKILEGWGAEINVDVPVNTLKVAYQQMVAIAKALSLNNRVLILDEPTAVFTSSEIDLLFSILQKLKSQGIALLYISHHLDEIFRIGDRVTVLRDGTLIRTGAVDEFNKSSLVKAMVGRDIDFSLRNGDHCQGEELLRAEGVTRHGVVEDASFSLHCGEIVGVAGLVGAGRTEMARLLVGADRPDRGKLYLRGQPVEVGSPKEALLKGIGMLPENRKEEGLVLMRSMSENIAYSLVEKDARFGLVPWRKIKKAVQDMIQAVDIRPARPALQVLYMSGGNQQKVVLSRLLLAECDLMILDEPTRGVDVGARLEIYKIMQALKKQGKAILMISSDLPEILTQADRILVMAKGRIAGELTAAEATEEKVLSIALRLGEAV